jgi:hypothetical protein
MDSILVITEIIKVYLRPFIESKLNLLQKNKSRTWKSLASQKSKEPKTQSGLLRKAKSIEKYTLELKKIESNLEKYKHWESNRDSILKEILEEIHSLMPAFLNYIKRELQGKSKIQLLLLNDEKYNQYMSKNPLVQSFKSIDPDDLAQWIAENLNPTQFSLFIKALQDHDIDGLEQIQTIPPPSDPQQFLMYLKHIKPAYYNDLMSQKQYRKQQGHQMTVQQMKKFYQDKKKQEKQRQEQFQREDRQRFAKYQQDLYQDYNKLFSV